MSWEKSIFIGCTHGDIVCPKAVKIVKTFMEDWKPKHRVHLGDLWDFSAIRRGAGPEERAMGIRADYHAGLELLDWFKPQLLTLGNHDHRIWRVAEETSNGPLADLMRGQCDEAEEELRKRKIKWVQWGVHNVLTLPVLGSPKLLHGYRSTMYPARAHFEHWGSSIFAHVHKPDFYDPRHIDGGKSFAVGTLAQIDKMSYADGQSAKLGWRQSFLYGIHNTKTGQWNAWPCINENGTWISPQGILS